MAKWEKHKDDFILLLEAGFIAVNSADEDAALKLFRSAELLDGNNVLPTVGFGYLHLHKLELKQACERFEEVLKKEPHHEMTKTLLGLALSMQPNAVTKGEKILEQTVHSKNPMIKELSNTALDFVERFIKKPGGPAGPSKRA